MMGGGSSSDTVTLGVDLGTTFTAAAVSIGGRVEVVALGTRSTVMPSTIFINADGSRLVGDSADARAAAEPDRYAREFKRRLGDPTPLYLGGVPYGADALTTILLVEVVRRVEEHRSHWRPANVERSAGSGLCGSIGQRRSVRQRSAWRRFFFGELHSSGNLLTTDLSTTPVRTGEVAVAIDWTYNLVSAATQLATAGKTLETNVPSDGVFCGFYAQAAVKNSPNPNAGKLWVEWLLSDEGALSFLAGGGVPARYAALVRAGKVPEAIRRSLPSPEVVERVNFPTVAQDAAALALVTAQWATKVSGS